MAAPGGTRLRRRLGVAASVAALAVGFVLAVVWPGYDAQQTPLHGGSVWVLQNGTGSAYARVNLELGEIDTVKPVENGNALAQSSDRLLVFSDGGTRYADVDPALPAALTSANGDAFAPTPAGTVEIDAAGDVVAFRTDAGDVYTTTLSGDGPARLIDPYADASEPGARFAADALAVDDGGIVYAYAARDGLMLRADARTGRVLGLDAVPAGLGPVQLSGSGGRWLLFDEGGDELWLRGRDTPLTAGASGDARVQRAVSHEDDVYIADSAGLLRVDVGDGTVARVAEAAGTPVAPVHADGETVAAWLGESGGQMWSSRTGMLVPLDYGDGALGDEIDAVFVVNGTRVALNERRSGWVWTVPDGRLVASSQRWTIDDRTETVVHDDVEAERVIDPRPPVAVDDDFGVRAGTTVRLPVLLNDHDPNEDVLAIDPASLETADPAFGEVALAGAEQEIVMHVAPDATGTTTLSYRADDGTASSGLVSAPATVTVRVVPDDVNSAPVWCGVEGCVARWPSPEIAPGGTISLDVLDDWVDHEGDPVYLAGATILAGGGTIASSPDGTLTYQHPGAAASDAAVVSIAVLVSDTRGARTAKELTVAVTSTVALEAGSFAVTGVAGEPVAIDVGAHVRGGSGPVELAGAVALDEAHSSVTTGPSPLGAVFHAPHPGSYSVQYTVRDAGSEATGLIRVVVRDPASARVSTPPVTAFVRPNEDATVDVLAAVANPAGLVLLVSDILPRSDPFATLGVDLVGQSLLRVSGSTDDGEPGRLGIVRYTISDGTGRPETTTTGELTVVLLPSATAEPPIAIDDAVTVRAGDQVDIPVLDNDTAPAGALIGVDPSRVVNESGGGLAFATSRVVRYFAPEEPGTYAIGYTIYRLGFPEVTASARVLVTVTGDEDNHSPMPGVLEGRVLSGQSVRVPFSSFGIDPDGDAAVLDRVLEQPAHGSATVAPEGDAIVYTSPAGFSGQVRFSYQVRDARGATGSAEVRIGVLDALTDARPVTYSDYVQIRAGADSWAVLRPADNDIDPSGKKLTLESVRPAAPSGSLEHERLAARIGELDDDAVRIAAGPDLGTYAYEYTVRNATGDTAVGLIVVKVVRDRVPDYPTVADTALTAESREDFPRGVDVLTGKVSWTAGDVDDLTVTLWGEHPGIRVSGSRISGPVPDEPLLIPFEVSGTAFDGETVSSYGFLRVPGTRDLRLTLRAQTPPLPVTEGETAELDMAGVVAGFGSRALEIDPQGVRTGGARAEASCTLVSGTTIRYEAGWGAPWSDTCVVPIRVASQDTYTHLTVRVEVQAARSQPVLRSASLTLSPGDSVEYDLDAMVSWSGSEDWDTIAYALAYDGDQFDVQQTWSRVTVTARESARPGREESIMVSLPSHGQTASAALNLTVGPAVQTRPQGGTAEASCSQAGDSTECDIVVIGAPGEVNPLPGAPLQAVAVTGSDNCPDVGFTLLDAETVRASWPAGRSGASECTGSFVVEDAQGRRSSGDRDGRVILDLQGLPAAPARVDWTAFDPATVTLRAIAGAGSHPAVTGYEVSRDGEVVATCDAAGVCPPIEAPAGVPAAYAVRAVSPVGLSRDAVTVEAWPYRAPAPPTEATFAPVPAGGEGGRVTITLSGIDPSTGQLRIAGGRGGPVVVDAEGRETVVVRDYDVGSNLPVTLTATPLTAHPLPPIPGGAQEGSALQFTAHGVGAPRIETQIRADRGRVTVSVSAVYQDLGTEMRYGFSTDESSCSATGRASSATFDAPLWEVFRVWTCAQSVWADGTDGFGTVTQAASIRPTGPIAAPPALTYAIEAEPRGVEGGYEYRLVPPVAPSTPPHREAALVYESDGAPLSPFALEVNRPPGTLTARWCDTGGDPAAPVCSDPAPVTARGSALYPVRVSAPDVQCTAQDATAPAWTPAGIDRSDVTVTTAVVRTGDVTQRITYTLAWTNRLTGLQPVAFTIGCAP
ncbi:Ig-like domain-containing protein [Microbacterium sp. No. 7]|uniref:Ig-like domain-containing protein n=1 Tax=Microbacterium sp. No. 7 TaxID=1714373 RepID=UPI0006D2C361|nr:Ig-like domain-containing protein [Microbacterium sp. No. 7]